MPISTPSKWWTRKAPTLQIEILNLIATEGQVSKTLAKELTGSHFPDVSNAIDALEEIKFIKLKLTSSLHPKSHQRKFFQLTQKGIETFIDGKPSPSGFWKAIYLFCKLNEEEIDKNTFDVLYRRFQTIYLGYTPHLEHFFQFRFIDILFKKWLKDNDKIYDRDRDNIVKQRVDVSQRILECLGMNRSVTLGQLCEYIEEQRPVFEHVFFGDASSEKNPFLRPSSEESIKSALEEFTLPGDYCGPYYQHRPELRYDPDWILIKYIDLIQHLVVVPRLEKGETRYELSLFGIAFLLSIRVNEFLYPDMLFYINLKFGEFCSKLSTIYKDKLPLIFGKWDSLMRETSRDNNVIFEILRHLFDDHTKLIIESSVIVGGVKEYYESVQTLSNWSYPRLDKILKAGEEILEELAQSEDCYCHKLLSRKMDEISNSLSQRDLRRFMESLHADSGPNPPIKDPHRIYANELVYIEKALEDEISFLFYIFFYVGDPLHRDRFEKVISRYLPDLRPVHPTYFPEMFKPAETDTYRPDTYRLESFMNMIRKYEDVQQLLVNWIDDASKCQNDIQSKMSSLKDYTRKGD